MESALGNTQLVHPAGTAFPFRSARFMIYVEGRPTSIACNTNWFKDANTFYIGAQGGGEVPLCDRLGVMAALITAAGVWNDAMTRAYSTAVTRTLLESYNTMMSGLLHGQVPVTGLAFNADRTQAAALMGDRYFLPGGVEVVPDETWTIVQ
jgi:hypothetical protein